MPFQQAGIPAFLAIDLDWGSYPHYHETSDTWDEVEATVGIALQIARAAAGTLADVAGHGETIIDRTGRPRIFTYDDAGNMLTATENLGQAFGTPNLKGLPCRIRRK